MGVPAALSLAESRGASSPAVVGYDPAPSGPGPRPRPRYGMYTRVTASTLIAVVRSSPPSRQ